MRLDNYLVEKGYYNSRNKAQEAIKSQSVMVNSQIIDKCSFEVLEESRIEIIKNDCPYVSRGGLKLEAAIKEFNLDFTDKTILDIGASTGGFTDCALKFGAKLVYAVDVGTNQLAEVLKNRDDVISLEKTNILDFDISNLKIDYIVMDVSFVSIEKLLPALDKMVNEDNSLVCLIKPQFEVGKMFLKKGIVKDKKLHLKVLENVSETFSSYGLAITKAIPSPILGGSGNKEFLVYVKRTKNSNINFKELV